MKNTIKRAMRVMAMKFVLTLFFAQTGAALAKEPIAYQLPGLREQAEIIVDRWGIPHIYAKSQDDAFFVQGLNAARDRLWQINFWRKHGLGELAKTFGPSYAEHDRAARLFLYRGDMYREWLSYGSDSKRIAEAFASGVKAYIRETQKNPELLHVEFKQLGYQPTLWAAEDIVRIHAHGLTRNASSEIARARIACNGDVGVDELRSGLQPPWRAVKGASDRVVELKFTRYGPVVHEDSATGRAYLRSDFRLMTGPSFRMVLDVGSSDESRVINTPGQSGNPASPHYRDMVSDWEAGRYLPLLYTRMAVEKEARVRILLRPSPWPTELGGKQFVLLHAV